MGLISLELPHRGISQWNELRPGLRKTLGRMSVMFSTFSDIGFMYIYFRTNFVSVSTVLPPESSAKTQAVHFGGSISRFFFSDFFSPVPHSGFHFRRKPRGRSIRFHDSEFSDFKYTRIHSTVTKIYFRGALLYII